MHLARNDQVRCAINVTPLVDVVLVLLILFMVIAPRLDAGPALQLPTTERAPEKPDEGTRILLAIGPTGAIWIGEQPVEHSNLRGALETAAARHTDSTVVIRGDARLTFGVVKRAVQAVEAAGFGNVGLIAERREETARELVE